MSSFSDSRKKFIQDLIPIALGFLGFVLVAGLPMLYFQNIAWLGGNLDPAQHFLGWALYRNGPWTFPIGLNPFNGIEFSNSIVFSDSLPIFAFLFKPFRDYLPQVFQYFGLWTLICFVLQAWFAWKLLGLISQSLLIRIFGVGLFIFSPPMMMRVGLWTALASHFLLLAALYLNFRLAQQKRIIFWALLVGASSLIHFYLMVMVLALWLASLLDSGCSQKQISTIQAIAELAVVSVTLGFCMWQAGYFAISSSSGAGYGFGSYQLNLLAPIDARGWSYIFSKIPMQLDAGNGFNYFGLGALILVCYALLAKIKYKKIGISLFAAKRHAFLYMIFVMLTVFSISNTVRIGYWQFTIPLPDFILQIASILRASGRMFWPVLYFIFFFSIACVLRSFSKKSAILILGFCLAIQIIDTSAGWLRIHQNLSSKISSDNNLSLHSPIWRDFGERYKKIQRFPLHNHGENWEEFASLAAKNKIATSSVFFARFDEAKLKLGNEKINTQLRLGPLDSESLYILGPWKNDPEPIRFSPKEDMLAKIDGFTVLAPGWKSCASCPRLDPKLEMTRYAPNTQVNEKMYFYRNAPGRNEFMLDGWIPYGELWGSWTEGPSASLIIPLPEGKPKFLRLDLRAFVSEKHPKQLFEVFIDGQLVQSASLAKFEGNQIDIPLPRSVLGGQFIKIQIKLLNPASPKSLGISDDDRQLGIGLISAIFH